MITGGGGGDAKKNPKLGPEEKSCTASVSVVSDPGEQWPSEIKIDSATMPDSQPASPPARTIKGERWKCCQMIAPHRRIVLPFESEQFAKFPAPNIASREKKRPFVPGQESCSLEAIFYSAYRKQDEQQ